MELRAGTRRDTSKVIKQWRIKMILKHHDNKNKFESVFDTNTGLYIRHGITESGEYTDVDPFMASFPELIDIGIMGHCIHGLSGRCKESGIHCYQHGDINSKANMTMDNYKMIIDECANKTYQVALGGCGDPDQHENFEDILKYTREHEIIPNFTTSGFGLTKEKVEVCTRYCGAVAVSMYSRLDKNGRETLNPNYTLRAISMLVDSGITTNVHYVLSTATIDEAIVRLQKNLFPKGINAVIFLLNKPVGLGKKDAILSYKDKRIEEFFKLIDNGIYPFKIGFDSCTIPGLINFCNNIDKDSIDTCEAARWSMYITPDMKATPCSFDNQDLKYAVDIREAGSIEAAWNSQEFELIRNKLRNNCPMCKNRQSCLGGCPLMDSIVLCNNKH